MQEEVAGGRTFWELFSAPSLCPFSRPCHLLSLPPAGVFSTVLSLAFYLQFSSSGRLVSTCEPQARLRDVKV